MEKLRKVIDMLLTDQPQPNELCDRPRKAGGNPGVIFTSNQTGY
ncbi:MAG TPA: hypothetical protein PLB25_21090 [Rhodoferax sp.]|nr:hypothetical protein [Rhodoferax sp.]